MEEKIGNVVLDLESYGGTDLYSEGEQEDALLEAVRTHTPAQYNELIKQTGSWSFLYHLSHLRENIIEWMPRLEGANVLEIGAGCGAVTGALTRHAKQVTCVELSKKRSMINAYRHRECANLCIRVGNFEDVEKKLEASYDVITLIGVFEYGGYYINDENPYPRFLQIIKKHLKPHGVIVIAIENKYGMKYFAGCREDHLGQYYAGIEGYRQSKGLRTFSKPELERLFAACGFADVTFYYPYPDYKLPVAIYSDEYLPKIGELQMNKRNFDGERIVAFDEAKAFDETIRDGSFPFFSNSFLITLAQEENSR